MRRKSERKSSDASSSAPIRRTSRRSKKSPLSKSNESNKIDFKCINEENSDSKELIKSVDSKGLKILPSDDPKFMKCGDRSEIVTQEKKADELTAEHVSTEIEKMSNDESKKDIQITQSQIKNIHTYVSCGPLDIDNINSESKKTLLANQESNQNCASQLFIDNSHTLATSGIIVEEKLQSSGTDIKSSENSIKQGEQSANKNTKTELMTSEKLDLQTKSTTTKKRKWLSKNSKEINAQIMSISSDSLKNLIFDVHPVPLSDIKLESSSEVEEVCSENVQESDALMNSQLANKRDREQETKYVDESQIFLNKKKHRVTDSSESKISPNLPLSPPKNEPSTVLFITNLVRPFTILQLKGLLARTGHIKPGGFWIDRIKSMCYVRYETEDEATETRHALHGVRWPASNPKCLNVDFGDTMSLEKAIASTRHETPTFGQDSNSENRIIGTGWDREFDEEKVQVIRPVREWDVGKKEGFGKDIDKGRDHEKIRVFEREKDREEKVRRRSLEKVKYCCSISPDPKKMKKKENDPPLRLLDDLFRKTTVTPCIYWLPLTPEQIAEKEAFRLKRITEHQERMKQRELERERIILREKERAKEKDRQRDRDKDKDKERKRDRSDERRKSRSRDRRRY